eukprot:gene3698-2638_t
MARKRNQTKGKPETASKTTTRDHYGAPAANLDPDLTNCSPAAAPEAAPPATTASTVLRASLLVPPTISDVTILPADAATPATASASAPATAQDQAEAEAEAEASASASASASKTTTPHGPRAPSPVTVTHHERLSDRADTASGTIACPPAQLSYVEANRSCLQRELGVGIRVSEAAAQAEITISAPSAYALAVARVELEALLHDSDESPHPLRVKIEALKREKVHVFVDNSNVYLGAQTTSRGTGTAAVDGGGGGGPLSATNNNNPRDLSVRLKVGALSRAVINSRCCQTRIVFGAKPSASSFVWKKWQEAGFTVQAVDAGGLLFSMIDATIAQYAEQAHTLVLVTGDGNAYDGHRASFLKSAGKALRRGWKVEVWAWRGCTSDKYRAMEQVHAADCGRFSLHYLDTFRAYITFQQSLGGVAVVVDEGTSATPDDDDESCPRSKPSAEPRGSPSPPVAARPTDGQRVPPVAVAVAVAAPTVDGDAEDEDENGHRRRRRSDRGRCRTRWSQAQR